MDIEIIKEYYNPNLKIFWAGMAVLCISSCIFALRGSIGDEKGRILGLFMAIVSFFMVFSGGFSYVEASNDVARAFELFQNYGEPNVELSYIDGYIVAVRPVIIDGKEVGIRRTSYIPLKDFEELRKKKN